MSYTPYTVWSNKLAWMRWKRQPKYSLIVHCFLFQLPKHNLYQFWILLIVLCVFNAMLTWFCLIRLRGASLKCNCLESHIIITITACHVAHMGLQGASVLYKINHMVSLVIFRLDTHMMHIIMKYDLWNI